MPLRKAIAFLLLALPALAAEYGLELKPENTKVEWTLSDAIHTVHGTFRLKNGAINFDTSTGKASGQVVVDVRSGSSGSEARDHRMLVSVLEAAKYPDALFIPDRVEGAVAVPGASSFKLHGMFTIHGAAHELTMNVQTKTTPDQAQATITFEVPYVAWGMKDPSNFLLKVTKSVQVSIEASGSLQKRP